MAATGAAALVCAAAFSYVAHGVCHSAAHNARRHWKHAQEYPPDKEYASYHFEEMDWRTHNRAKSNDAFWTWMAKACLRNW